MDGFTLKERVRIISFGEDESGWVGKEGLVVAFDYDMGLLVVDVDGEQIKVYADEIEEV